MQSRKKELTNQKRLQLDAKSKNIYLDCSSPLRRTVDLAQEKGSSAWLTSFPLKDQGFALNKQEFWDSIALRYNWYIPGIASKCECGAKNTVDHCLICMKGGFVAMRHNELRNTIGNMLRDVCKDVSLEPALIPLTGETLRYKSGITSDGARLDISARGFWSPMERTFFDVRVSHPNSPSHLMTEPKVLYKENEQEKKEN